jgi:hypothetical protein
LQLWSGLSIRCIIPLFQLDLLNRSYNTHSTIETPASKMRPFRSVDRLLRGPSVGFRDPGGDDPLLRCGAVVQPSIVQW